MEQSLQAVIAVEGELAKIAEKEQQVKNLEVSEIAYIILLKSNCIMVFFQNFLKHGHQNNLNFFA